MIARATLSGRRVLLTGHTGFKGSWLSVWLHALGAEVTGFSDGLPTERSLFVDAAVAEIVTDVRGDIRDLSALMKAVDTCRPDLIIHMAAQALVRPSYIDPAGTYATNVMGTVNVLEAARLHGTGCPTLVVTTDKCYENREWFWGYREDEAMGGHDPYSSSKGCAELVASAYHRSYSATHPTFRVATGRAGNVIGGGDWSTDRLIPDIMRGLEAGRSTPIRNPEAIRPWQHVLEPLSGYLLLARHLLNGDSVAGQGWNFGPAAEAEVPVRRVADTLCRLAGQPRGWHDCGNGAQPHEAQTLRLDITKARAQLGWVPQWTLEQALEATLHIYRSRARNAELRGALIEQIERHSGRIASCGAG